MKESVYHKDIVRLGKFNVSEHDIKSYCSVYKITNGLFDDRIIKVVRYSLDCENMRYIKAVKREIKSHLHNIFNYKKLIDLVDNPDDLKLNYNGMNVDEIEHFEIQECIILYD